MEDGKIVDLYLSRDERAIEESANAYGKRLRQLSFGITGDKQVAEECENDTYLSAWNLIPPNEPRSYLYAFLARIARHKSLDLCRRRASLKRGAVLVELNTELETCLPAPEDVEDELAARELGQVVSRFLRTLPQEKRVMFVRRYFCMDSVSDIAKRCAVTEGKVKSTLFRTRNALREELLKEGYRL